MALQLVIDDIDKVDEKFRDLYVEKDGKYRLDVDGVEDVTGLKNKRDELLQKLADSKSKLSEKEEELKKALRDSKGDEDLRKSIETERAKLENEKNEIRKQLKETRISEYCTKEASKHANGTGEIEVLSDKLAKCMEYEDGEFWIVEDGKKTAKTVEDVVESMKEKYPFLFKGRQSSGAGSEGGSKSLPANWKDMTPSQKINYGRGVK